MPGVLPPVGEMGFLKHSQRRIVQEMFTKKLDQIVAVTSVVGATGGTSGLIKITAANHGLTTGDKVIVADVQGTVEANGYFTVTVIDPATFTLDSTTFVNTHTGGGAIYNGTSWTVTCAKTTGGAAPATPYVVVVNNYKQINASGAVVATPQAIKVISSTSETEIMLGDSSYGQAVSSLVITNNTADSITGSVNLRTTKLLGINSQSIIPFVLLAGHSLVVGGDGNRQKYDAASLPVVS